MSGVLSMAAVFNRQTETIRELWREIITISAEKERLSANALISAQKLLMADEQIRKLEADFILYREQLAIANQRLNAKEVLVFWIDPDDVKLIHESNVVYTTQTSFDGNTVPLYAKRHDLPATAEDQ